MPNCKVINKGRTKVCIGAMRTIITLHVRSIVPPSGDSTDFNESFTNPVVVKAQIETVPNIAVFDQTNTERLVSHIFYIRYRDDVTAETWIELNGDKYDIINTENIEERNQWLILRCNQRGIASKPVNFA